MKGNHRNPQPVMPVYNRKISRNKLKNAVYSTKENHAFNRRRFISAWQRLQVKRFGGIKQYIIMRIHKKARRLQLDITLY